MNDPSWDDTTTLDAAAGPHSPVAASLPATQTQSQTGQSFSQPSWDDTVDVEEKYSEPANVLKSIALGAARGGTFGLSDQILVRSGAMTQKGLKEFEEFNPTASFGGEALGILGSVAAPIATPVKAVSKIGSAVTEAALPVSKQLASKIASIESRPVLNKILTQSGAHLAGSAVEGAAYGLGNLVSEEALGDADLNAENVLAALGSGAIIGGALGATYGGIKGGLEAKFPSFFLPDEGGPSVPPGASVLPEFEQEGIVTGLQKQKPNAQEIKDAAAALDNAPVLPSMTSANDAVIKAESSLIHGAPTISGLRANQMATEGFEKMQKAVDDILGPEIEQSKASLGQDLKAMVQENVEKQLEPINQLYDELKSSHEILPVNPRSVKQVARNIRKLDEARLSPQAQSLAEGVADRLETIKNVDDIKRLKSIVRQELGLSSTPIQKHITSIVADKLANLEETSIIRFAEKTMKTSKAKDKIMSLLDLRKQADAQYKIFKDGIDKLGSVLGKKRVYGANDFLNFLDELTPEKVADRLSNKNNSEFLKWFSKDFPAGMKSMSGFQKNLIRDSITKDGTINVSGFLKNVEKMPKEFREAVFSGDQIKKIDALKTYHESFPKNYNPSNTGNIGAFRYFFEHPLAATSSNVRDLAIQKFIEGSQGSNQYMKNFVSGLSAIERTAKKTQKQMQIGIKKIFSPSDVTAPVRGFIGGKGASFSKDSQKEIEKLSLMMQNPETMMAHLHDNTEGVSLIAPGIAQGLQGAMLRGLSFLNEKIPTKGASIKPLSAPYQPSQSEWAKWEKYKTAVENPLGALEDVANGTLVKETMETLSTVYPKLLQQMQTEVMGKLSDSIAKKTPIPYQRQMMLSMFLGTDLVASLEPASMIAMQQASNNALGQKNLESQLKMNSGTSGSVAKMKVSNRMLTPMQKASLREGA